MVATFSRKINAAIKVDTIIPTKEPGTLGIYLGVNQIAAKQIPAVATLYRLTVARCKLSSLMFSTKFSCFSNPLSPKKLAICPLKIITAIPEVNPMVTGLGINLINAPSFSSPITTKIIPARKPASNKFS
ncbi:hypothetical protein D3C73_1224040 [compost metagenome]